MMEVLTTVALELTVYLVWLLIWAVLLPSVLVLATPFILVVAALRPERFSEMVGRCYRLLLDHMLRMTGFVRGARERRRRPRVVHGRPDE